MALPWLESLPCFADTTAVTRSFPKRFGVIFMGNGVNEDHWGSEGSGAEMKLSKTLAPLEPLKHKINVIHGLFQKRATGQGIHPAQTGCLLSGRYDPEGRHHPSRRHRRSDDRQPNRPGHAAVEHRSGLRAADDGLSRDELLDGVQLAHLLAESGLAGPERSLSVARLGQSVRKSRQPSKHEHSRPSDG